MITELEDDVGGYVINIETPNKNTMLGNTPKLSPS